MAKKTIEKSTSKTSLRVGRPVSKKANRAQNHSVNINGHLQSYIVPGSIQNSAALECSSQRRALDMEMRCLNEMDAQ